MTAQAVAKRVFKEGESSRLDFLCYAHRARAHGHDPVRLFVWLIHNDKREFITYADEEDAAQRVREYLNGPRSYESETVIKETQEDTPATRLVQKRLPNIEIKQPNFLAIEAQVQRCLDQARIMKCDPVEFAQRFMGWTETQWQEAYLSHQIKQQQLWNREDQRKDQ